MPENDATVPQNPRARIDALAERVKPPAGVPADVGEADEWEDAPPLSAQADDADGDEELQASSPDLVFTTTAKDRTDSDVGKLLRFDIDGEFYEAMRPKDDAFVFLTTAAARSTPMAERMSAIIQFIDHALTEESGIRIRDRLLDREDDFSFEDLLDILQKIVRHWGKGKGPRQARRRGRSARRR